VQNVVIETRYPAQIGQNRKPQTPRLQTGTQGVQTGDDLLGARSTKGLALDDRPTKGSMRNQQIWAGPFPHLPHLIRDPKWLRDDRCHCLIALND
jgi:hypothetical protein